MALRADAAEQPTVAATTSVAVMLKLEIGGDANSTDGSEPSHQHVRGDVNCNVGYEFWLGEQAVARNPDIKLYGLPWTAPGWIGNHNFWSQDMIDYDISWLNCAKGHGLTISYLGGWNERGYDKGWYEKLRSSLNAGGFGSVKIVGADSGWDVANDMVSDATFTNVIDVIGAHPPRDLDRQRRRQPEVEPQLIPSRDAPPAQAVNLK